jgi:transposase
MKTNNKQNIKILKKVLKSGHLTAQEQTRIQAVLLKLKGYSHKDIQDITLKSKDAIKDWVTAFNQNSIAGLKNQPITKPRHYLLTKQQKDKIKQLITNHSPEYFKLTDEFWSVAALKQLVKQKFKTEYKSRKAYIELLKYCGLSYQKVEFKDSRADETYKQHMKLRLQKKLKKGVLRMYW